MPPSDEAERTAHPERAICEGEIDLRGTSAAEEVVCTWISTALTGYSCVPLGGASVSEGFDLCVLCSPTFAWLHCKLRACLGDSGSRNTGRPGSRWLGGASAGGARRCLEG